MTTTTPSTATGSTAANSTVGPTAVDSRAATCTPESTAANRRVDAVSAAVEHLAGLAPNAGGWPPHERRALLARLDRAVDALAAVRAAVLLAERDSGAWQGAGDRSFEAWRARTSRAGDRAATAQVRQAEHLGAVPSVAAAAAAGQVPLEHAATIGRVAVTGTLAQQAAVAQPARQARLIALAQEQDAGTFATTVARWAASIDPAGLERDHQAQRRARFLHLADTPRGTVIKGQVDTMAGHRLRLALEALSPRPSAEDDRDPGQRSADALDAMAAHVLTDPGTRPGAHVPPHVSLILTEETWHAARAERDRRRAARARGPAGGDPSGTDRGTGSGTAGGAPAPVVAEPATLEDGTPVPPSELARVMCDCDVTRIAIDAEGAPLDLGRTQRLFTGPQRRAVIARDRECIWPDCHAPARWCEIHHTRWWERDGGPTSVDAGALICSYHHHEVHRRDLTITRLTHPADDRTSRRRPGVSLARVRYEVRDPTGRPIRPTAGASGSTTAVPHPRQHPDMATAHAGERVGPRRTPASGGVQTGRQPPDPLDLEWATDPTTGMNVPAILLGPR